MGGASGSRDLSQETGYWMCQYIPRSKYRVIPVQVTGTGAWQVPTGALATTGEVGRMMDMLWEAVPAVSPYEGLQRLLAHPVEAMMTTLRGAGGDDGSLHDLGNMIGVPVLGPKPAACQQTAMKHMYPAIVGQVVGTPSGKRYRRTTPVDSIVRDARNNFVPPFFVKPAAQEGSFGVERIMSGDEALAAIQRARKHDDVLLQEEMGGDEVSFTLFDNDQAEVQLLPAAKVVPIKTDFYDAVAKRKEGRVAVTAMDWNETPKVRKGSEVARDLYDALDLQGLATFDMKLTANGPVLLDANTVPTLTRHSLLKMQLAAARLHPTLLLQRLIERALSMDTQLAGAPGLGRAVERSGWPSQPS